MTKCPSAEMHKTPSNYAFWQHIWAELCRHYNTPLTTLYHNQVLKTLQSKVAQSITELKELEQSLANQQKLKATAPHRIKELTALLKPNQQPALPPLQYDLYQEELTCLNSLANQIKLTKTRITKLKKDLQVIESDYHQKLKDPTFKDQTDNHATNYIMKYGYIESLWSQLEHLLPPNTPPYKG